MSQKRKMLIIYLDETDRYGEMPAYEAVVRKLLQLHIAGATAMAGIMGFGSHHLVHRKRLLGVADDRPITITAIDEEEKIRSVIPQIRHIIPEGLIALMDVEIME
jgi:PII-like signaling protein